MDWVPFHHPTDNFSPFVRWLEKFFGYAEGSLYNQRTHFPVLSEKFLGVEEPVKSHIVYRLCNHMVYTLSLIQPGVIVQEIALFECVNSLVQVDAADSELSEHQCDLPRERRLANGDAFPTKPFA